MINGWVFALFLGGFGWQVHNIWIGLLIFFLYMGIVIGFNTKAMNSIADSDEDIDLQGFQKKFQKIKWITFIIFLLLVMLSGIEIVSAV